MKRMIKAAVVNLMSMAGLFPVDQTGADQVSRLIKQLHPLKTDKKLIRLGPAGDGGYLVPDDLEGIAACFSPGVNRISGFEEDCAERGIRAFLADASVEQPPAMHELFHFTKKFLGATTRDDYVRLDDWVEESLPGNTSDLMLQMDIEGFEYEVLLSSSSSLIRRFRVIVIEFHQLDQLWNRPFFTLVDSVFNKLLETHACVHIHPNNCRSPLIKDGLVIPPMMEFTFLRKDRIEESSFQYEFPHPLDADNTANPSLVLPECWYGQT